VFAFDLTSMRADDLAAVRASALEWVNRDMVADTDMASVVALGSNLNVVSDFTAMKEALRAALQSTALAAGEDAAPVGPPAAAFRQIGTLCEMLAPIQRRKSVLFFAGGRRAAAAEQAELRAATTACSRANVLIYPVDARGLQAIGQPGSVSGRSLFIGRE
jgi:hypothetical protein